MDNTKNEDLSNDQQDRTGAQQGEYKNVETSATIPSSQFGDSDESKSEDKLPMQESRTEDEGRTGKK